MQRIAVSSQVRSSYNTPVKQGTRRALIKKRGWNVHIRLRSPVSPSRGGQRILSVFVTRSTVCLTGRSRIFIPFMMRRVHLAPQSYRWCYGRQHLETLHDIVPDFLIVQVAPIFRPLGTFQQQLHRRCEIVSTKQTSRLLTVGGCVAGVAITRRSRVSPL